LRLLEPVAVSTFFRKSDVVVTGDVVQDLTYPRRTEARASSARGRGK
jgi:hypothetical protein